MNVQHHLCREDEIHLIEKLAYQIWPVVYNRILSEQQIKYMLKTFYPVEYLIAQLHTGTKFYLITENNKNIGFISYADRGDDYYIQKFYLDPAKSGKNIGTHVYNRILEELSPLKPIRLNVNRYNIKAINFYFKIGFKIESFEDIKIGAGFAMNDFVMHTNPERHIKKSYP